MPPLSLSPGQLAQLACLLEATARKPGNVHRYRDFEDSHYLDYLLSASAIVRPLDAAREISVGAAIFGAVEATRRIVLGNTNLGMILLLAPLAAVPDGVAIGAGVARVLDALSVEDARLAYRAIRLARPGGLGSVEEQDVATEPTVTLREAMRLASDRDMVARQYADGFAEVLGIGLPALRSALNEGERLERAILRSCLTLLARLPDSLIVRKRGTDVANEASRRARDVLDAGLPRNGLDDFDAWLRGDGHARNPGTSADLVTAALFVALREGIIPLPLPPLSFDTLPA